MFGLHHRGGLNQDTAVVGDRFRADLSRSETDCDHVGDLSRVLQRHLHPGSCCGCVSGSDCAVPALGWPTRGADASVENGESRTPKMQALGRDSMLTTGKTVYLGSCPACRGGDGKSKLDLRAPELTANEWSHAVPPSAAFDWLAAGWSDLIDNPVPSLIYGFLVFLVALGVIAGFVAFGGYYVLVPVLAGFMIVGPLLAVGLYEKSRRLAMGDRVGLPQMIFVKPALGGQVLFTGVLLSLLILVLRPLPGFDLIAPMLFTTRIGWALVLVGGAVGILFAAFSFAISVFGLPIQLDRRVDALTAMGASMALVWNNLPVMLVWGGVVLGLLMLSLATGLLGLIVLFPLLGHGTWYAYRAIAS